MQIKKVSPERILALCDFPVHNEHVLKMYFHMFRKGQGKIVPPCPVLPLTLWPSKAFGETKKARACNEKFIDFLTKHPQVAYVVLDGTHKTTAATLNDSKILVAILRTGKDIKIMKNLAEKGEIFSFLNENTIKESIDDLAKHFLKFRRFETVAEKTDRMVSEAVLPNYMIEQYRKAHP